MNILLWVLQILAALIYGASGIMKVFLFDKVSADVPSFGALPAPPGGSSASWNSSARPAWSCPPSSTGGRNSPSGPPRSWRSKASSSSGYTSGTGKCQPSS